MQNITRELYQILAESLGRANYALTNGLGDLSKYPGSILELEAAFTRLHGATLFHDDDVSKNFLHFGIRDNIGLGIQGARLDSKATESNLFPHSVNGEWNPTYSPPCTEGWNIYDYHIWKHWQPSIESCSSAWDGLDLDQINLRLESDFPINEEGERVALFNSARFISFCNNKGSNVSERIALSFSIPFDFIDGLKMIKETSDGVVIDANIYYHLNLMQSYNGSWQALEAAIDQPLTVADFSVSKDENGFNFVIEIPFTSDNPWLDDYWFHIILYWGSTDSIAAPSIPLGTPHSVTDDQLIIWHKKNFFNNDILNNIGYDISGINDVVPYLIADNRTNEINYDGNYSEATVTYKYPLPAVWKNIQDPNEWFKLNPLIDSIDDTLSGFANLPYGVRSVVPVNLCVKTGATIIPLILTGPEVTPEFFPDNWENCSYFPQVPAGYILIAQCLLARPCGELYDIPERGNNFDKQSEYYNVKTAKLAVIWFKQCIPTFASRSLSDNLLYMHLLPSLSKLLFNVRLNTIVDAILDASYSILITSSRLPNYLLGRRKDLSNPASIYSIVFRGLLKRPNDPDMLLNGSSIPLEFSDKARDIITKLSGAPPSTDLLRFDANKMYLTGERLSKASELEIYQEPTVQSYVIPVETAGEKIGQDYTLRLTLEDENQNLLIKNWYIMASKFFVTNEELSQRERNIKGTAGYFTQDTLDRINEWRLYGYAGLIPDLYMGVSRLMQTRVVAPPDNTQLTEAQFIKQLQNQGKTQAQIDLLIADYLDTGTFYIEDLRQYSNDFVAINDASLAVSQYKYTSESYWTLTNSVADCFTIAQAGLEKGDIESDGAVSDVKPAILACFNREDILGYTKLAPPNKCRQIPGDVTYFFEGFWSFAVKKFDFPQEICIYPKAIQNESVWNYLPNSRDIHVLVRTIRNEQISDFYTCIRAGNTTPIVLRNVLGQPNPVDGIVFMAIAKGEDLKSARVSTNPVTFAEDIVFDSFEDNTIITQNNVISIDGVELQDGDRVLIKDFVGDLSKYNGIYSYRIPPEPDVENITKKRLVRATDMSQSIQLNDGVGIRINDGSANYYVLQTKAVSCQITSSVVGATDHQLTAGTPIYFTIAIQDGVPAGTQYYVIEDNLDNNSFKVSRVLNGDAELLSNGQAHYYTSHDYPIILNNTKLTFVIGDSVVPSSFKAPRHGGYLGDRLVIRST